MSASAISGNQGYVLIESCDVAEFTDWSATIARAVLTYNSRSGGGWQQTVRGNKAVRGKIGGKYDPSDPIETHINVDTTPTLQLHMNSTDFWSGAAMFGDIQYEINNDTGAIIAWTVDFESQGQWTKTS